MRDAMGDNATRRSYIIRAVQRVDPRTGMARGTDRYLAYWSDGTSRVQEVFPAVVASSDAGVRGEMQRQYPEAVYTGTYGDITTRRFRFPAI